MTGRLGLLFLLLVLGEVVVVRWGGLLVGHDLLGLAMAGWAEKGIKLVYSIVTAVVKNSVKFAVNGEELVVDIVQSFVGNFGYSFVLLSSLVLRLEAKHDA